MQTIKQAANLNEIQIGLLRMFDRHIPDTDIQDIKRLIIKHLSWKLFDEVENVIDEKGITENDFLQLENADFRTKPQKA